MQRLVLCGVGKRLSQSWSTRVICRSLHGADANVHGNARNEANELVGGRNTDTDMPVGDVTRGSQSPAVHISEDELETSHAVKKLAHQSKNSDE